MTLLCECICESRQNCSVYSTLLVDDYLEYLCSASATPCSSALHHFPHHPLQRVHPFYAVVVGSGVVVEGEDVLGVLVVDLLE